jgi:hypothetical protein
MRTTKKRRNGAFGAAVAKKDAKAYTAPTCRFESGNGKEEEETKRTTRAKGMIIVFLMIPY